MLIGGIRYSVNANNQTKNRIEITQFISIMVWGSDRVMMVRHNLSAPNKVTSDYGPFVILIGNTLSHGLVN